MQYCGCRGGCAVTTYSAVERLVLERGRELGWLHTYSTAGGLGAGEEAMGWLGSVLWEDVALERGGYGVAKYSTVTGEWAIGWLSKIL